MYREEDFKQMANDPKFMSDRWQARAKSSEREYDKRASSLSSEERKIKQDMIKSQYERAKMYKDRAKKA